MTIESFSSPRNPVRAMFLNGFPGSQDFSTPFSEMAMPLLLLIHTRPRRSSYNPEILAPNKVSFFATWLNCLPSYFHNPPPKVPIQRSPPASRIMGTIRRVAPGSNRVVIVQGASGTGKTTALRIIAGRYGERVAVCEAADVWNDKPSAMLGAMLRALGHDGNLPLGAMARMEEAQKRLSISRRCMVVDEAHHMGPKCLNTIKTLVNTTPGEFVLVAIPTLWAKLESAAYQEARQLSTNRLSERVRISLTERDIAAYLGMAVPALAADEKLARAAAKIIRPPAEAAGNMAFVRDVARLMPAAPTIEDVAEAIKGAAARR